MLHTILAVPLLLSSAAAPWSYEALDAPPQVVLVIFGHEFTDAFLFTFIWFGGLALLAWAIIHEVSGNDGPRAN